MRRIRDFKEVHTLYSPAHRKTTFPQADWRFLATVAMNCAATLDNVHQCGVVVGDVNQSNILVSAAGLVALIDCDSFQIQSNGQTYPCAVGVPLFTPPELQNQSFRGIVRTPNHDRFGLAVLIFHLLIMGRHPFSGRFLGKGDMPIERAIAEYRFAYGPSARNYEMQPPLHALTLGAVSPPLAALFERAFDRGSDRSNARPSGSDWYGALRGFLQSLRACPADPGHFYPPHLAACPWCELMRQGAPNFFVSVAYFRPAVPVGPVFVLATIWARIEQVTLPDLTYRRPGIPPGAHPTPLPPGVPSIVPAKPAPPPILTSPPSPPAFSVRTPSRQKTLIPPDTLQQTVGLVALVAVAIVMPFAFCLKPVAVVALLAFPVFGGWWIVLEVLRRRAMEEANREYEAEAAELRAEAQRRRQEWAARLSAEQARAQLQYEMELCPWKEKVEAIRKEAARRRKAREEAAERLRAAEANWVGVAAQAKHHFEAKKEELRKLRQRHEELARAYAMERQGLHARAREMQLVLFLQQQFISDATIPGVGPTRTAALASFGIETSFDIEVSAVQQVPGFGPKLTEKLLYWRKVVEAQFRFNPVVGVPPPEQRALDMKYSQARQPVEMRLLGGPGELQAIVRQAEGQLPPLSEHIRSCLQVLVQSEADLTVLPQGV